MGKTLNKLSLNKILDLNEKEIHNYYRKYVNHGLHSIYKILGFNQMDIESSKGLEIKLKNGKTILDFTSGIGVLALGHNHPSIIEVEKKCHDLNLIDVQKFGINRMQSGLAYNLACLLPDPLDTSFFTISGSEAIEAGIKLITRVQPVHKKYFITFKEDYHGKTHGALSFTNSENFASGFHTGINRDNIIVIAPGDINAIENTISDNINKIAGLVIEPIQGQVLGIHPREYLKKVLDICKKNNILTLVDEVKVGMGRTGELFSFMEQEMVPDVLAISKALGGGKRAIGAMVTSSRLFKLAYGKRKDSTLHSTTFGGLGTSCAVAIETLNIISEKSFLKRVNDNSEFFMKKLLELKVKYPSMINEVTGKGLFIGITFNFIPFEKKIKDVKIPFVKDIKVVLMGSILRYLYRKHNLLTHFTPPRPDMLVIMPPLIINRTEILYFTDSLDEMLSQGLPKLFSKFLIGNIKELA
jgi:acetylornithine/succinyldiaminopimelate/putrescine aminotransferase